MFSSLFMIIDGCYAISLPYLEFGIQKHGMTKPSYKKYSVRARFKVMRELKVYFLITVSVHRR